MKFCCMGEYSVFNGLEYVFVQFSTKLHINLRIERGNFACCKCSSDILSEYKICNY